MMRLLQSLPERVRTHGRALCLDSSGLAMIEFAASLPFILLISLTGAELTNYATTKMRVSQVALQLAATRPAGGWTGRSDATAKTPA